MAVTTLALGYKPSKGIDYTHTTDTSADFPSVPNDTFFYNLEDELPYYKDGSGNVLSIFSAGGADGNGIYDGSGSLSGATNVSLHDGVSADYNLTFKILDTLTNGVSNTGLFTLDSVNNVVGIGTDTPTSGYGLVIESGLSGGIGRQLLLGSTTRAGQAWFRRGNDGAITGQVGWLLGDDTTFGIRNTSGSGIVRMDTGNNGQFLWNHNTNTELMRLTTTGLGIGETSPSAKLHVGGNTQIGGELIMEANLVSYPHISLAAGVDVTTPANGDLWYNGTNLNFRSGGITTDLLAGGADGNGIYSSSSFIGADRTVTLSDGATTDQTLTFASLGDANLLFLDSVNDRIGIGAATPTAKLHLSSTATSDGIAIERSTVGIISELSYTSSSNGILKLKNSVGTDLIFLGGEGVNYINRPNQKFGFGTDAPTSYVQVVSPSGEAFGVYRDSTPDLKVFDININASTRPTLNMYDGGGSQYVKIFASPITSDHTYFNHSGNFGIGTTTPSAKLHVAGDTQIDGTLKLPLGATNGYVLTSDATGLASWQPAAGGATARTQLSGDSSVTFTAEEVYNTAASPLTGNITVDQTGAVLGIVQKLYHNDATAPTITGVSDVQIMGDGVYFTGQLNVIYLEWTETNRVEYWIVQEQ